MFIAQHHVVAFHFSMYNENGKLIQQTFSHTPNRYLHGSATIDIRLQHQMEGLAAGEKKELTLKDKTGMYNFVVHIDHIRMATDTEIMLGYPVEVDPECGDECECYISKL